MGKYLFLWCWVVMAINTVYAAQPNVVIIYADDMGYGDLGENNPDSKIPTPNLDKLAAEGCAPHNN
jgi:arylsulfatase A